jgi:hypothetical protein
MPAGAKQGGWRGRKYKFAYMCLGEQSEGNITSDKRHESAPDYSTGRPGNSCADWLLVARTLASKPNNILLEGVPRKVRRIRRHGIATQKGKPLAVEVWSQLDENGELYIP